MARLYSNENFPLPAVEVLRALGHDVLTTQESGRAGLALPDTDVLTYAIAERRAVVTINRKHFVRLHQVQPEHSGIIVCTFDRDFPRLAQRISDAIATRFTLDKQLLRVNRPS